jgi:uncharacterized protein YndB with AHSA1/START domain
MAASNAGTSAASDAADREIILTREFQAPRDLVFEAWTNTKHVAQWWGPNGFSTTIHEMDVRPGGVWRLTMRGPDGRDYNNRIVFIEVAKPGRLVYKHEPEKGSEPVSFQTTVTFAEQGDKTEVTVRMLFPSAQAREHVVKKYGAIEGLNQTLGRLGEHLEKMAAAEGAQQVDQGGGARWSKKRELVIERVFNAPRELVFKAWTKPEHMVQWWGPRGFTLPTCEMEFRAGGRFRLVMRGPDGKDYPFQGAYLEIVEPERIVFQGTIHHEPGHQVWTTVTFAEHEGKTKLTVQQTYSFESDATRGAPEGWRQQLDRLGEYLARA